MQAAQWRDHLPAWAGQASDMHPQAQEIAALYRLPVDAGLWRLGYRDLVHWRIACWGFWPRQQARGTLWLWHGLFDHIGLYQHLIRQALQCDYAVLGIDLPGHGLSSGEAARIDDFASYQLLLQQLLAGHAGSEARPWKALGQSTGAGILIEHLLRHAQTPLDEVMLLAPLVRPAAFRQVQSLYALLGSCLASWPRNFRANSSDEDFLRFIRQQDPLQAHRLNMAWVGAMLHWERGLRRWPASAHRLRVLQGERDETVDWVYNLAWLQAHFRQAQVQRLPGASHQLANEGLPWRRQVEQAVAEFLECGRPTP